MIENNKTVELTAATSSVNSYVSMDYFQHNAFQWTQFTHSSPSHPAVAVFPKLDWEPQSELGPDYWWVMKLKLTSLIADKY